ncbi:MAG: (2Fe-2S)-binding protein [Fimbriimonadaceae bacterium]|nr:(2Fe-2S)-binding protein [Fimbriimonadaceae bacterium]
MSELTLAKLQIDGREVAFEAGQTVLAVATAAGIDIPNLCAYPTLKPFGRCRLCCVEIEGVRGYPSACTTPATAGMVVRTESPELLRLRRGALELVLTEHPTGCLLCGHQAECVDHHGCHSRRSGMVTGCRFCPRDQQCELQTMVQRLELHDVAYPVKHRGLSVDRRDPFFDRDYNLCILCARCVRVCDEQRQAQAVALTYRGPTALVGTAFGQRLQETACQFCGECVDACPTASLAERVNKWVGTPTGSVRSTCLFCGLGCQLELRSRDGQLIGARPADEAQHLCARGRFAPVEVAVANGRVIEPLARRGGQLVPVEWDEALAALAAGLAAPLLWASSDLLNEDLAAVADLAAALDAPVAAAPEPAGAWDWDALAAARTIVTVRTEWRYFQTAVQLAIGRAVAAGARLLTVEALPSDLTRIATAVVAVEPGGEAAALDRLPAHPLLAQPGPTVLLVGQGLAAQGTAADAAVQRLAAALGAVVLTPPAQANASGLRAALPQCGSLAALLAAEPAPGSLLSFGRPPLTSRGALGFWAAWTHLLDPVTATADLVLPATIFTEQSGSLGVDAGRRAVHAAVPAAGECRPVAAVVAALQPLLGTATPRPAATPPEAPSRAAGRELGRRPLLREVSTADYLGQSLSAQVPGLLPLVAEGAVQVHPADALELQLSDRQVVILAGPGGSLEVPVQVSQRTAIGTARLVLPALYGHDGVPLAAVFGENPGLVSFCLPQ